MADRIPRRDEREPSLFDASPGRRFVVVAGLALATALLAVGLALPIVTLRTGLSSGSYSVLTGVVDLTSSGNVLLASVVLTAWDGWRLRR